MSLLQPGHRGMFFSLRRSVALARRAGTLGRAPAGRLAREPLEGARLLVELDGLQELDEPSLADLAAEEVARVGARRPRQLLIGPELRRVGEAVDARERPDLELVAGFERLVLHAL